MIEVQKGKKKKTHPGILLALHLHTHPHPHTHTHTHTSFCLLCCLSFSLIHSPTTSGLTLSSGSSKGLWAGDEFQNTSANSAHQGRPWMGCGVLQEQDERERERERKEVEIAIEREGERHAMHSS